jgi:hypothetical protein
MRSEILAGVALAIAAAVTVRLGANFGLELDSVALLGLVLGALIGMVPENRTAHLVGFGVGFGVAWVSYLMRAAVLPDSSSGRAVAAAVVILALLLVHLVSRHRMPTWPMLVGVAALVGAYEEAYTAAPSQVVDTSTSSATAVLLAAAIGFMATSLVTPIAAKVHTSGTDSDREQTTPIDELMTESAR